MKTDTYEDGSITIKAETGAEEFLLRRLVENGFLALLRTYKVNPNKPISSDKLYCIDLKPNPEKE